MKRPFLDELLEKYQEQITDMMNEEFAFGENCPEIRSRMINRIGEITGTFLSDETTEEEVNNSQITFGYQNGEIFEVLTIDI